MFGIYWQKIILLAIFSFVGFSTFAQNDIIYQSDYDAKRLRWGFFIGGAVTSFDVKFKPAYLAPVNINATVANQITSITSPSTGVMKAGAIMNIYLNEHFDLRISPLSLAIYDRKISFNQNDSLQYNQGQRACFEVPILLKYKSLRRKNTRMYAFAGLNYSKITNIKVIRGASWGAANPLKSNDFCFEYGFGLDLFREFYKFSPEIHIAHGIKNAAIYSNVDPTNRFSYIDRLRTHTVSFILCFD